MPNQFGPWLEATMQSRGLSQAEVARRVGVADAQVSRWRRGQVRPSVHYLQRIAETLDVPRASLDRLTGYPPAVAEIGGEGAPPQVEAEIQAYQARLRDVMETRIPRSLWPAYAAACEALAEELEASLRQAVEAVAAGGRSEGERLVGFQMGGASRQATTQEER